MVMNYRIRNECGQWYKGDGEWGPIPEVAEVFDGIDNLPGTITNHHGRVYELYMPTYNDNDLENLLSYAGYYDREEEDSDWCYARIERC